MDFIQSLLALLASITALLNNFITETNIAKTKCTNICPTNFALNSTSCECYCPIVPTLCKVSNSVFDLDTCACRTIPKGKPEPTRTTTTITTTTTPACGVNEEFQSCYKRCENLCNYQVDKRIRTNCGKGCFCKDGFSRDASNTCSNECSRPRPRTDSNCRIEWRKFKNDTEAECLGVNAGFYKDGVPAIVGRSIFDGQFVPGRIQTVEPFGFYHPSAWNVFRILTSDNEYLVDFQANDFIWVPSKNSEPVPNAVSVGDNPGRDSFTIGRITKGAYTYLGKITPNTAGINYEDENAKEVYSPNNYEVLTCVLRVV